MTIHLHIGTNKTGTSTVQRCFSENREILAQAGHLYPRSPGLRNHTMLAIYAGEPDRTRDLRIARGDDPDDREEFEQSCEQFRTSFLAECSSWDHVILSNEHCYTRLDSDESVDRLRALLEQISDDIRVICYVRRQDQHLLSGYSTAVVSGSTSPIDLSSPPHWPSLHRYHTTLDRWARAFGEDRVAVRPYERDQLAHGDIVADLLRCIGIHDDITLSRVDSVNESLDAETLEFLRLLNRHVPRIVDNKLNPARHGVVGRLSELSTGPRLALAPDVARRYVAVYDDENRLVAERFVDPPSESLFDDEFHPSDSTVRELQIARAVELGAALFNWRSQQLSDERTRRQRDQAEIGELRSRLETLELELDGMKQEIERSAKQDADLSAEPEASVRVGGSLRSRVRAAVKALRGPGG